MSQNHRKPVIGLLGGVGSGKSLVAKQLASLGCGIVDADALARAAIDEPAVRHQLVQWWGQGVINPSGQVDRKAVAAKIFNNRDEKARLEGVIHPRVMLGRQDLHVRYNADPAIKAIVEDCPLLLETGLEKEVDALVFVESSRAKRIERVAQTRGWSADELDRREKNQLSLDTKRNRADHVIVNEAGEQECFDQTRDVLSQILQHFATV